MAIGDRDLPTSVVHASEGALRTADVKNGARACAGDGVDGGHLPAALRSSACAWKRSKFAAWFCLNTFSIRLYTFSIRILNVRTPAELVGQLAHALGVVGWLLTRALS